jgi:2-amino-4-hydroxy-6-hydroxymethyldihydropteridine diphosphokinase
MQLALERLAADAALRVREISPIYENRAVGMGEADPFLNAIASVDTSLAALDLLDRCLTVETALGRVRTGAWAPRTIDLDVIAYGEQTIEIERLHLPHPRIAERDFVVHPLNAIAPDLEVRGQRVADLAASLPRDALTLYPGQLHAPAER